MMLQPGESDLQIFVAINRLQILKILSNYITYLTIYIYIVRMQLCDYGILKPLTYLDS